VIDWRWRSLCERVPPHGSVIDLENTIAQTAEAERLNEDEHAALWLYGWSRRASLRAPSRSIAR
jgi:hypothetical protein